MTEPRAELLEQLAQEMARAGDSVPGGWDKFAVVADITALGVRVTGFRYDGDAPGLPMLMDADVIETIAELRTASPGPNGEFFDVYVARLDRTEGSIVDQAFSAATGSGYRVTAANVARIAGLVRPGSPFLPPTAQVPIPPGDPAGSPYTAAAGAGKGPDGGAVVDGDVSVDHGVDGATEAAGATNAGHESTSEQSEGPDVAGAGVPGDGRDDVEHWRAVITHDLLDWPAEGRDDWSAYGGAAAFTEAGVEAVGFRYRGDEPEPTVVGGAYLEHLQSWRAAVAGAGGPLPEALLLRLPSRDDVLQAHFVSGPDAARIRWTSADAVLAGRLRPSGPTGPLPLRPRAEPDLLDVTALLERARGDVAASLRGVGGWHRAALGVDCSTGHSAGRLWSGNGDSRPWRPLLPPDADLAELRTQTVRRDGARWAGARIWAWADSDRVDVTFFGPDGVAELLDSSPEVARSALEPPPTPPAASPSPPWPAQGGSLDAEGLLDDVAATLLGSPDLGGDDWQRVTFVVVFADDATSGSGPRLTPSALRYRVDGTPVVTSVPAAGPVGKLLRATGGDWSVCVLQGRRDSSTLTPYYLTGRDAERFRLDPDTIAGAADALRPV